MSEHTYLKINGNDPIYGNYYIPYLHLIPFKPSNYDDKTFTFKTTVKDALIRLSSHGLTLGKVEGKISDVIHVNVSTLKKFRETGLDELYGGDDSTDSIEVRLELFREDHPEVSEAYSILQQLEKSDSHDMVTLNIEEIRQMYDSEEWYENIEDLFEESKNDYKESLRVIDLDDFKDFDIFINHDFKDKDFVEQLAKKLDLNGIKVWYDDFTLNVGDCLMDKIQEGLKKSRYGIVVLSQNFIHNISWAKEEFESLQAKEKIEGRLLILPIWRNDVSVKDIGEYNYALSLRVALLEEKGLDNIIEKLVYKISNV